MGRPNSFLLCIGLGMLFLSHQVTGQNAISNETWFHVNYICESFFHFGPAEICGEGMCLCCLGYAKCVKSNGSFYIPKLPELVVYLSVGRNDLTSDDITEHFFSNVTNLACLDIEGNNITYLNQSVFRGMTRLKVLQVGRNPLTPSSIRNVFKIPGLEQILADRIPFPSPPVDFFRNISSDVELAVISGPAESSLFDISAFCFLSKLQQLEILGDYGVRNVTVDCVMQLEALSVVNNTLIHFLTSCTHTNQSLFPDLTHLDLSGNSISSINTVCLPKLKTLNLSKNKMSTFFFHMFQSTFPSLEILSLKHQSYRDLYYLQNNCFQHPTLHTLLLDGCDIDFNPFHDYVNTNAFANCPKLQTLSLAGNNFEDVNDLHFLDFFGHLPLRQLDLSHTNLDLIPLKTFLHFKLLSNVTLKNVGLSEVPDGVFDSLRELQRLDLSDNKITSITPRTFSEKTRRQLSFLGLEHNPFMCSCDLMWFRDWVASNKILFSTSGTPVMICKNFPGLNLADFTMTEQACLLGQETSVLIMFTCSIFIVTLTTFSLVFRFRWHIRLALYEAFRGRGDVRRLRLLADTFDYDVFVSYASEDLPWVRQHLMPELEGRQGLRLCVHERDFIIGNNIVDNIVGCVQSSKKILMVFSKDFVRSQWCQFELTFCLNHVMQYEDSLIIVCVDDVTTHEMPAAMMAVLKTTTYIQWAELDGAVESFWGRLRLALCEVLEDAHPFQ